VSCPTAVHVEIFDAVAMNVLHLGPARAAFREYRYQVQMIGCEAESKDGLVDEGVCTASL
jgi:hypothetical protein